MSSKPNSDYYIYRTCQQFIRQKKIINFQPVTDEKTAKVYARVTPEAVRRIMDDIRAKKNPAGGEITGGAGATGRSGEEKDHAE